MDQHVGLTVTRVAGSGAMLPNRFVIPAGTMVGTTPVVNQVSSQNADATGVLVAAPDNRLSTMHVPVALTGVVLVDAGGAVNEGQDVITDNQGRAIADPQTGGTTSLIRGKAMSTISSGDAAAGGQLSVLLVPSRAKY